ncbi:MAG: DUF5117 domain-containing protein [Acidobacteria bacterium]|nr:DUF5117 domain-containing protein [Acidobacteriota bacterium]
MPTGPPNPFQGAGMRPGSATVVLPLQMVKLPEKKMMPRIFDERVGYFTVRQMDYGKDEQKAPERTYITRWRLEKKDPNAEVSEPIKADSLLRRRCNAVKMGAINKKRD